MAPPLKSDGETRCSVLPVNLPESIPPIVSSDPATPPRVRYTANTGDNKRLSLCAWKTQGIAPDSALATKPNPIVPAAGCDTKIDAKTLVGSRAARSCRREDTYVA